MSPRPRSRLLAGGLAGMAWLVAPALAGASYVYGPKPDWTRYRELGTAAALAKVPDPTRWAVDWPNGYIAAGWLHHGGFHGYMTCGVLRATAPVDGLWPRVNFVAVIDHDQVQTLDISQKMTNSLVNVLCADLINRGRMPPASLMEPSAATPGAMATTTASTDLSATATHVAPLGLTVRPMPEGAYVTAVDRGSPAAAAGLMPGTVLVRAGGIALAGLGDAMARVLAADRASVVLDTAAGAHVTLRTDPAAGSGSGG